MTSRKKASTNPPIESLVSETEFEYQDKPWTLRMTQEPSQARMSGHNKRLSRPLDPIPVLELSAAHMPDYHNLIVCARLCDKDGVPVTNGWSKKKNPVQLVGNTVVACNYLRDHLRNHSYFFIFNDMGVTSPGFYRVAFSLYDLSSRPAQPIATVYSQHFQVFSGDAFQGLKNSTPIMEVFRQQGILIHLRNPKIDI